MSASSSFQRHSAEHGQSVFQALPPRNIQDPPPVLRQPVLLATYSHQPDRSIAHDDSSMAYYRRAPIGADLTYAFERQIERDEEVEEHLDGLCYALMKLGEEGKPAERRGGVITWRGMTTRLMTAPFERDGWEMTAMALDGSVYLELHEPPEQRRQKKNEQSAWAVNTYMGYAYESYSTVPSSGDGSGLEDPNGWSGDVNTNVQGEVLMVQWCNIVRSAVGHIPLCLGGEVDCVRAEPGSPHPGLDRCVELKTNKVIKSEKQEWVFHRKLLKHWAQSWLLGIPTVEVGFRDDEGILRSQAEFETVKIPRLIASLQNPPWSPAPCYHFLHASLSLLCKHVLPSDPTPRGGLKPGNALPAARVWRMRFHPNKGCELRLVGEEGVTDTGSGRRWGGVLPEDYVRWRMRPRA